MQRQVYGRNPQTGRVGHFYVDHGPAKVAQLRGVQLAHATTKTSSNVGRRVGGGTP